MPHVPHVTLAKTTIVHRPRYSDINDKFLCKVQHIATMLDHPENRILNMEGVFTFGPLP